MWKQTRCVKDKDNNKDKADLTSNYKEDNDNNGEIKESVARIIEPVDNDSDKDTFDKDKLKELKSIETSDRTIHITKNKSKLDKHYNKDYNKYT